MSENVLRVAVAGAGGRMGSETVRAVSAAPDLNLVAQIGRGDDLAAVLAASQAKVLVEFTLPEFARRHVEAALEAGVVPLVGTSGLSAADLAALDALSRQAGIGVLVAPNFAIGAVLLMRFAAEAARYLPDAEIIEMHHERKIDAPSGTAIKTAEMIAAARNAAGVRPLSPPPGAFESVSGARGGRSPAHGEPGDSSGVPVHSVRLPGFVASQEVLFGGPGQRLSLRHDSVDRTSFMPGVLLAIRCARSLPSGLTYGLENLL